MMFKEQLQKFHSDDASDLLKQISLSAWPIRSTTQASVVHTLDSAIHRINHYPVDKYLGANCVISVDRDLSIE